MQKEKKLPVTKRLTLLYVEDDAVSREQLRDVFEMLFASVTTACNGADGFEKYKQKSYDIVITDINMPKMDGLELIEAIKKIHSEQKVIIISAHSDSAKLLQAIELGVDNFIIKPVKLKQLNQILHKVSQYIQAERLMHAYQEELETELEKKTAKLMMQVITDELTGLHNRNALMQESDKELHKVLLLLNIDNFDSMNVTYGYDNGDKVLQYVAKYLKSRVSSSCVVYRLGADEFAIVTYTKTLEEMYAFAQNLQEEMNDLSIDILSSHIKLTFTMALTEGKECLLKKAHIALKDTHNIGRNRIGMYTKNSAVERLQVKIQEYMPKLQTVIASQYITPYFQAIVNNKTGKIEKYECLARIVDEDKKVISPFEFINIAELTGMIIDITKIMVDKSFKVFANNNYEFSINISEYDLNDGYLRDFLQTKLKEYNIEASRVVIEVLEGISAIGAKQGLNQLLDLKRDGFSIAIDDFGVQNSNFERVHAMQVDYIKIDGRFIKHIDVDKKSYQVAKSIHDFAKSIGAKVIAEYVHSKEIQDIVVDLGIEYSQGYYFSEPNAKLLKEV
jgi:diguanylate cyclase (GGDEF)-like protein